MIDNLVNKIVIYNCKIIYLSYIKFSIHYADNSRLRKYKLRGGE